MACRHLGVTFYIMFLVNLFTNNKFELLAVICMWNVDN